MFLFAALSLGFLGSLHCVGMCGPIALALPVDKRTSLTRMRGILLYNLGRVLTYSVLGLMFGLFGKAVAFALSQNALSVITGGIILVSLIFQAPGIRSYKIQSPASKWMSILKSGLGRMFSRHNGSSLFIIGLLNGMLPCGLVYMGIAGAVATGDSLRGALFMALFGMGTIPAMTFVTYSRDAIRSGTRQRIKKLIPVMVGLMGILLIMRGLNLGIPYISPELGSNGEMQDCCRK